MRRINKFLASPLGSIVKLMTVAGLAVVVKDGTIHFDKATLNAAIAAAVAALGIVVQNWANKSYKNYGK